MYILGISTMTESAASLLKDGVLIAAADEERFTRKKHAGGIPYHAIQFVLESQGLSLSDVDHLAVYWNPYKVGYRTWYILKTLFTQPSLFFEKFQRGMTVWNEQQWKDSGWADIFRVNKKLGDFFKSKPKKVHFLDHHMTHMAATFYGSGWDDAAILIMDGAGESACTTVGVGKGLKMEKLHEHLVPHSLGHFYSAVTGYLGFKMLDGEYKMMGLSPYGDTSGAKWIRDNYLITTGSGKYVVNTKALDYHRALKGNFSGSLQDHFGPARGKGEDVPFTDKHRDIAASTQKAFEEVVLDLARDLKKRTGAKKLAIAGGCGLNCTANGRILSEGIFEEIFVPPVPHDAGGGLGAAMYLHAQLTGQKPAPIKHGQYGPSYSNDEIKVELEKRTDITFELLSTDALIQKGAQFLSESKVLAWVQGPMEYGPRALGNRSFLADPRSDSIRDVINEKIKKRELFRPFAPSVKAEKASEYFEINQESPFMTIIVPVRPEKRELIPAVTHIDGTARPQTVDKSVNQKYWQILDEFEKITGVPVLLNTSFNIQEPVVCSPVEALNTFCRSGVDALLLGDYWVERK